MNILVTGAKGMVGTALVNNLKNIDLYDPRYASGDDPNVGSKPWDDAVERNKLLNGWGMSDQEWSEMNAAIPYTGDDRERAKAIFQYRKRKAEMSIQQDVASDNFATNIASQAKEAQKTKDALDALGDNDSLATQQLIARQQQLLIETLISKHKQILILKCRIKWLMIILTKWQEQER